MKFECCRKFYARGHFFYEIKNQKEVLGKAECTNSKFGEIGFNIQLGEKTVQLNQYNILGALTKRKENEVAKIYNGQEESMIYYCTQKGSNFFNGIFFWKVCYEDRSYEVYEVGHGRKGIYYCIWSQGKTIAIISKEMHTKNFESNYFVFCEEDVPCELLVSINIFIDITRYFPSEAGEEFHALNTWQKELKNKYDPDFIPRIMAMEKDIE